MGYTVKWHGVEITAATADEAVGLAQKLAGMGTGIQGHVFHRKSGVRRNGSGRMEDTLNFLTAIQDGKSRGADGDKLCSVLNISKPKAIGAKAAVINRVLDELGFKHEQVYSNARTAEGRFWKGESKLPDAMRAVEERMQ